MNTTVDLYKKVNVQKLADEGSKVYEKIKSQYEPKYTGKFLAIEVESKKAYMGKDGAEALVLARENHPDKVFYLVKIGYAAVETIAKSYLK